GGQGFLRHARHPDEPAKDRAHRIRTGGGQPRPEATGLSRGCAAPLPDGTGCAVPYPRKGHLQHRHRYHPGEPHLLQPVLPAAARHPVWVREEIGATKIALGHHRDDIMETLFLNLFHGGSLKAMPPKLLSDDKRNIVIRPLAYCTEEDLEEYAEQKGFPIIPCNLCGSQENLQRKVIKDTLRSWERQHPGRVESIFRAIGNVAPSQLMDTRLFDFQ